MYATSDKLPNNDKFLSRYKRNKFYQRYGNAKTSGAGKPMYYKKRRKSRIKSEKTRFVRNIVSNLLKKLPIDYSYISIGEEIDQDVFDFEMLINTPFNEDYDYDWKNTHDVTEYFVDHVNTESIIFTVDDIRSDGSTALFYYGTVLILDY